jgi:hypothetical protein
MALAMKKPANMTVVPSTNRPNTKKAVGYQLPLDIIEFIDKESVRQGITKNAVVESAFREKMNRQAGFAARRRSR